MIARWPPPEPTGSYLRDSWHHVSKHARLTAAGRLPAGKGCVAAVRRPAVFQHEARSLARAPSAHLNSTVESTNLYANLAHWYTSSGKLRGVSRARVGEFERDASLLLKLGSAARSGRAGAGCAAACCIKPGPCPPRRPMTALGKRGVGSAGGRGQRPVLSAKTVTSRGTGANDDAVRRQSRRQRCPNDGNCQGDAPHPVGSRDVGSKVLSAVTTPLALQRCQRAGMATQPTAAHRLASVEC